MHEGGALYQFRETARIFGPKNKAPSPMDPAKYGNRRIYGSVGELRMRIFNFELAPCYTCRDSAVSTLQVDHETRNQKAESTGLCKSKPSTSIS